MYWNGLTNLDDWNPDASYIVMDDVNLDYLPSYKQWFGAQARITVTDKYKKKASLDNGKPLIWLSNDDPLAHPKIDIEWLRANTIIVRIETPLWQSPQSTIEWSPSPPLYYLDSVDI